MNLKGLLNKTFKYDRLHMNIFCVCLTADIACFSPEFQHQHKTNISCILYSLQRCFHCLASALAFFKKSSNICFSVGLFFKESISFGDLELVQLLSSDPDQPGLIDCNSCQSVVC